MPFGDNPQGGDGKPSVFLKFEEGKKIRLHFVSKLPMYFKAHFNKVNNKFVRVPGSFVVPPGKKMQHKWAAVVLVEGADGVEAKVFEFGKQVKKQLDDAYEVYNGSFDPCDFVVGKTGKGLDTEWTATVCPTKGMKFSGELPKLDEVITFSSQEDIKSYFLDEEAPF